MKESETIIIFFRLHRSIRGPTNGPKTTDGIIATIKAVASTVAEPVSLVRYHANANCTTALPNREAAWLDHSTKNFFIWLPVSFYCAGGFREVANVPSKIASKTCA
jgi:hypothetical protein